MPTKPDSNCPDCNGTGWCVEPDGGAGKASRCECRLSPRERSARGEVGELEQLAAAIEEGIET
jgi:hypothetical protein